MTRWRPRATTWTVYYALAGPAVLAALASPQLHAMLYVSYALCAAALLWSTSCFAAALLRYRRRRPRRHSRLRRALRYRRLVFVLRRSDFPPGYGPLRGELWRRYHAGEPIPVRRWGVTPEQFLDDYYRAHPERDVRVREPSRG